MSKRRDTLTPDLFTWTPPKVAAGYEQTVAGRGTLDNRISRSLSRALKDAKEHGRGRDAIAKSMSQFLGRSISEDMLNKWASEASEGHRITLDAFIALIEATGAHDLMGLVVANFGFVAVPEKYSDLITLHMARERKKEMDDLVNRLEAQVRSVR